MIMIAIATIRPILQLVWNQITILCGDMYACMYVYYVFIHVCMYVCIYVFMYVCMYLYIEGDDRGDTALTKWSLGFDSHLALGSPKVKV